MAPNLLKKNINYIDILAKAKPKHRKAILSTADHELILCLCECVLNVLNGNVPLKQQELEQLSKFKSQLRNLVAEKTPRYKKREILVQKGGFLPVLLAPILGIAGQLLADTLIKKK